VSFVTRFWLTSASDWKPPPKLSAMPFTAPPVIPRPLTRLRRLLVALLIVLTMILSTACSSDKSAPKATVTPKPTATPTPTPKPPLLAATLATLVAVPSDLPAGWISTPEATPAVGNSDELAQCLGSKASMDRLAYQAFGNVISSSDGFQVRSFAASYKKESDTKAIAVAITGAKATPCVNQQTVGLMSEGAKSAPRVDSNVVMNAPPAGSPKSLKAIGAGSASFAGTPSGAVTFLYAYFYAGSTEVQVIVVGLRRMELPAELRNKLLTNVGIRLESIA
jgi:hypothetical protein